MVRIWKRIVASCVAGIVGTVFAVTSLPALAQDSTAPSAPVDSSAEEADHHEGYYYPKPQTVENYVSQLFALPESDKIRRQSFVIGMSRQLLREQAFLPYAIFAKGDESDKLIIVGLVDGQLNTVYRARGLLATFTSAARMTKFFQTNTQPENANFFDLLKLLGFRRITITDGREFCHQVTIN